MKKIIRSSTQYVINGREYHSFEAMPEQDRQFFLDANKTAFILAVVGLVVAGILWLGLHQ
jgi:hypothetical protein